MQVTPIHHSNPMDMICIEEKTKTMAKYISNISPTSNRIELNIESRYLYLIHFNGTAQQPSATLREE